VSLLDKVKRAKDVLNYGEQLANPATWKQRTARFNAIIGFLMAALPFIPAFQDIDRDTIIDIATGVGGFAGLWNMYSTYATSEKVGLNMPPSR
jgi:hypothetical protein